MEQVGIIDLYYLFRGINIRLVLVFMFVQVSVMHVSTYFFLIFLDTHKYLQKIILKIFNNIF